MVSWTQRRASATVPAVSRDSSGAADVSPLERRPFGDDSGRYPPGSDDGNPADWTREGFR